MLLKPFAVILNAMTIEDMKDFEYLYNAYHALGGNGTGTEIYERVKNLSIR